MLYLSFVGGCVVTLLIGLFLVYFFNVTKEGPPATAGGPPTQKVNPLGIFLDVVGGILVVASMIMLYILAVETGKHAGYRHGMGASEGQFTVADRLRSAVVTTRKNRAGEDETWVEWTPVENGTPLWYAVNVYVPGADKPNTDVLSSTQIAYGPLPKEWTKAVVWYGTSQGPSIPQGIDNEALPLTLAAPATAPPVTPPAAPAAPPAGPTA